MHPLRTIAFLILAVLSFSVCSCGGGSKQEDPAKPSKNDPKTSDGPTRVRLAFISNNPFGFWTYAQKGCEAAAAKYNVDLVFRRPSKGTQAQQKEIIEELMLTGVDGIAISPNDAKNFVGFLKKNVASKIPLVTQDNDLPDVKARNCYIGTHNYRAGRAAGYLVKKAVPKGKIVIFVGRMDVPNARERRQGVLDVLAGKEQQEMTEETPNTQNVQVGDYLLVDTRTDDSNQDACRKKAEEILLLNDDIACLIGLWEYNPPALLQAVKSATSKPKIVAFDENFQTLQAIQKGDIVGTVVQNPYMFGYESIKILAGLARKDPDVLKRKDIDAENRIYVPHRVVVRNPGQEKIGGSITVDVDEFYPEAKKLRGAE